MRVKPGMNKKKIYVRRAIGGLSVVLLVVVGTLVALAPFTGGDGGDAATATGSAPPRPQPLPVAQRFAAATPAASHTGSLLATFEAARARRVGPARAALSPRVAANIWTVSPTDTLANFSRIQAAIDAAAPGDLLEVWAGTYNENVVVNKQLILYSRDGPAATIVDANGTGIAVRLTAAGCIINGFTVTRSGSKPGDAGIKVESAGNTISDNLCNANGYDGLAVIEVADNVLIKNTCSGNFRDGIHLWGAERTIVSGNYGEQNRYGLSMLYAAQNELTENTFCQNGRSGLFMLYSYQNRLDENIFLENDWEGVYAGACTDTIFWQNEFRANLDYGLALDYCFANTVVKNTLSENAKAGIYLLEAADNLIYLNNFVNNSPNINSIDSDNRWNTSRAVTYKYSGGEFTNFTGNYWNDYVDAMDTNEDGIADLPFSIYEALGNGTEDDFDFYPLIETRAAYSLANLPPVAAFTFEPTEPIEDDIITFDASLSYDLDGALVLYDWDFGDEAEASTTDPMITHAYTTAGEYTVTLTVFDDAEASSTTSYPIAVLLPLRVHNRDSGEDFTMIQAAIDAPNTTAGDLIEVDPGLYSENIRVTRSLTIYSTSGDPEETVIAAADPDAHAVEIRADAVSFAGFAVTGATGEDAAGIYLNGVSACSITDNYVVVNDLGIQLAEAPNNEVAGNYITGSAQWDLAIQASAGNSFRMNTLASYPTTISFTYNGDLALNGVAEQPGDPEELQNIGAYLQAQALSEGAWLDLRIHYTLFDLRNVNESTLLLYRYAGEGGWDVVPGENGVNLAERFVYANLTTFSILAPFGVPLPPVRNLNTDEVFETIQAAIDAENTMDGHVLEVAPGYYEENVYVYKSVTIRSYYDVPDTTIVGAANSNYDVFAVGADNVTIRGFMIGGAYNASGIYLFSANNTIVNNIFIANYVGVYAEEPGERPEAMRPARFAEQLASAPIIPEHAGANAEPSPTMERGMSPAAQRWADAESALSGRARGLSVPQAPARAGTRVMDNGDGRSGHNTLAANLFTENLYGIALVGAPENVIRENTIHYNYASGIYIEVSDHNTVEQNGITDNELAGIEVAASGTNMIRRNMINGNYYGAVLYTYCALNTITENTVSGNYEEGISIGDLSTDNYIRANTVTETQQHSGISIWGASGYNYIEDNTVNNNSNYAGIALYDYSDHNTITNNTANGNMGALLVFFDGGRFNNITDNRFDANYDGIVLLGAGGGNRIANNSITYNYDGAMFIVDSNNNTIEANDCSYSETFSGIELQGNSSNNVLSHNTVNANAVHGISLWEASHHNTVTQNTANSNGYHGIMLTNSASYNTITQNTACYNKLGGITLLRSCTDNALEDNELCGNLIGIGLLRLETAPGNNLISRNTVRECESGVMLADLGEPNSVTQNMVTGNRLFGIVTLNSTGSLIHKNTATLNKRGIGILESTTIQVTENTVDNNSFSGISLVNSSNNNVTSNSATFNVYEGVHLSHSDGNTITYNDVSSNYFGITLYSSHNNTIIGNSANDIYYFEVFLFDSDGNTIDVTPYVQEETIHGVRMYIPETITPAVQAVEPGANASYYLVVENLGILADTFTLTSSSSDDRSLRALVPDSITLGPGESSARITELGFETITLNVSASQPGIYRTTVQAVSQNESSVKDHVETWTIVRGTVDSTQSGSTITDSVIINSSVVGSVITRSAIINSSIIQSTITDSILTDSSVTGTVLNAVILEGAIVTNGNISAGAITIKGIRYVIVNETSIEALVLGAFSSESNLVGLKHAKLLVLDAENATMGFEISASDDYFAGSLSVQKAVIPPDGIPEFENSTGEYYVVEASENMASSTGWLILKIYYDPDQLTGFNLSSLTILYYNEAIDEWEELIGQVNTTGHYVWVNISHYSIFAVVAQPTSGDGGGTISARGGGGKRALDLALPAQPSPTPSPEPSITPSAPPTPLPSAPAPTPAVPAPEAPTPTPRRRIPAPTGIALIGAVLASALLRAAFCRRRGRQR